LSIYRYGVNDDYWCPKCRTTVSEGFVSDERHAGPEGCFGPVFFITKRLYFLETENAELKEALREARGRG